MCANDDDDTAAGCSPIPFSHGDVLNPARNATYDTIDKFLGDMVQVRFVCVCIYDGEWGDDGHACNAITNGHDISSSSNNNNNNNNNNRDRNSLTNNNSNNNEDDDGGNNNEDGDDGNNNNNKLLTNRFSTLRSCTWAATRCRRRAGRAATR
jgi:hypothetical protein